MQPVQVQRAVETDVSAPRDDGAAMAAALHRLAKLRTTLYRDWSDGPSSLVAHANVDSAVAIAPSRVRAYLQDAPDLAFTFDPDFALEAPKPLDLRGRFDCLDEMPPPVVEEIDDVEIGAGAGAPVAYLLDLVRNLPKAPGVLVRPAPVEAVVDLEETAALAFGTVDLAPLVVEPDAPVEAPRVVAADEHEELEPSFAVGAIAGVAAWTLSRQDEVASAPRAAEAASPDEGVEDFLAVGAFGWIDAPTLEAPAVETRTPAPVSTEEFEETFAVGAVAACLAFAAPGVVAETPSPTLVAEEAPEQEEVIAYGAAANVALLLDLAPTPLAFTPPPVVDLEVVALDDFLADACEALYAAAFDPTELYAWGASELADGADFAAHLTSCEVALWSLPRVIPCGEVFAFNPNHEIAVQITRALRVRADTLRARAFTDHVNFGALRALEAHMPWFPSVEVPHEDGADTVDADTQFATWGMDDLATIITAPDRPLPILSEAELDALLATPAARDSHELEDDWQESPVWQETFWHDVDAYLQSVESDEYREEVVASAPEIEVTSDIEIRDESIAPIATHFWLPGDEADLAITGEGTDLFLIGGGDAGVVLVEDGAMHSMRTGRGTRMGEVVVSWSTDPWSDIDAMTWTRVVTLAGVSQLRVEQTVSHDRAVVVVGDLSACTLAASRVRLIEATEDGPREFPVRRIGGLDAGDWSFTDAGEASTEDRRLFV